MRDPAFPQFRPESLRSGLVQVACLAHAAVIHTRSWCANSQLARVRLAGKLDRAENEIALLKEEIRIKDTRVARIPARNRPYYAPTERLAILELKAARSWNLAQTAQAFRVEPETVSQWLKRIDEQGDNPLVRMPTAINKFPAFVSHVVQRLRVLCPTLGKRKMADILARAGLRIASTTVARMLRQPHSPESVGADKTMVPMRSGISGRVVTARHPNHVWHVDLTAIPVRSGFWVSWFPWAMPQVWPFCYWVAVVLDHFSRKIMGFAVFKRPPSSLQVRQFLGRAMSCNHAKPRYIVCDKGCQFWCVEFKRWCKRKGIRPRYGAVGKYGSIAVVERFIRSMKAECTRRILVPLDIGEMREELACYVMWYNRFRPHQALHGRTPQEVCDATAPPPRMARPNSRIPELNLLVTPFRGRKHLPIVELELAA